mmetsp:Transcript_3654/g.9860  ORF Transcript_3654/g.9860 Transcript_3654/m.9860 type:complete len:201 (-) Transcript_3654:301-903(-)
MRSTLLKLVPTTDWMEGCWSRVWCTQCSRGMARPWQPWRSVQMQVPMARVRQHCGSGTATVLPHAAVPQCPLSSTLVSMNPTGVGSPASLTTPAAKWWPPREAATTRCQMGPLLLWRATRVRVSSRSGSGSPHPSGRAAKWSRPLAGGAGPSLPTRGSRSLPPPSPPMAPCWLSPQAPKPPYGSLFTAHACAHCPHLRSS